MKIVLVCSAGMSTSLLVTRMKQAAEQKQIQVEIKAMGETELSDDLHEVDVVLIGPQVRYLERSIKAKLASTSAKCEIVDQRAFGLMQGDKVLEQALQLIEDGEEGETAD